MQAPPPTPTWDILEGFDAHTNLSLDFVFLTLRVTEDRGRLNMTATATNHGDTTYGLPGLCYSPFDGVKLLHPDGTFAAPLQNPIRCHGIGCDAFPPGATEVWTFLWDGGSLWGYHLNATGTHAYTIDAPFELYGGTTEAPCGGDRMALHTQANFTVTYPTP